jgi:CHAD domain-containing protein
MRPLRKAAKLLGPPRDARVLLETLNELNSRFEGALPRKSVAHLKSVLERNSETARVQFAESEGACRVCRLIRKSRKRVREITLKSRSWRQLEQNLGGSFIGSRTAFETARTEQSAENFHEWRKRVQDVRNQIDLLDSRKGAALSPVLKDLSQILGLDHDMVMLRKFAESHFASKLQRLRIRPLNESLKPFEEKLQVTILSRGAALYAGLPLGLRPASFPAKLPA